MRPRAHIAILFPAVLLLAAALLLARAVGAQAPLIAHYWSEFARIGFVLDRSGEVVKLRFDGTEEILALRQQLAAGNDIVLLRDDGVTMIRISGLGGVTLFTAQYPRGIPVEPTGPATPLQSPSPPINNIKGTAGAIMAQLRAETGLVIEFEANWGAAIDPLTRAVLHDAIRNTGSALVQLVRTGFGRTGIISNLRKVRFVQAQYTSVYFQGNMLIISFSVGRGIAGRPSSFEVQRQLRQIIR